MVGRTGNKRCGPLDEKYALQAAMMTACSFLDMRFWATWVERDAERLVCLLLRPACDRQILAGD
jgi:hypothetical protein